MPTAIVTITCPQCGGKVSGIEATDQAQVIPCTYCKTELHVPRVGEEIIREKVIERVVVQEPLPVVPSIQPRNTGLHIGAVVAALALAVIMMLVLHSQADDEIAKIDREDQANKQCEQSCKDSCKNAGANRKSESTGDPELDKSLDKTMREADATLCETDCWQKNNCYGAGRR